MNAAEVRAWLGIEPRQQIGFAYRDWWARVLDGMAGVPYPAPGDAAAQLTAFTAFLACAGTPPARKERDSDGKR